MAYQDRFQIADGFLTHLDTVMAGVADPYLKTRYTGFIAVTAVTVYELAIKEIFENFSIGKHRIFGEFTRAHFRKINGRITKEALVDDHILSFGPKYVKKFKRILEEKEIECLRLHNISIKASYGNIISWRHDFVHQGLIPAHATYSEARKSYDFGKQVIDCLSLSMRR